jgi:hypothetical protein
LKRDNGVGVIKHPLKKKFIILNKTPHNQIYESYLLTIIPKYPLLNNDFIPIAA